MGDHHSNHRTIILIIGNHLLNTVAFLTIHWPCRLLLFPQTVYAPSLLWVFAHTVPSAWVSFPPSHNFFFFSIWMTPSSDLSLNFTPSCCHCTLHLFINTAVCKFTFIWMDGWIVNVHFFHWTIHRLHEGRVLILQFIILSHCPAVVLAHGRCSSNVCGMTVD